MALTANDLITEAVAQYNDELQADSDYERIKIATWIKYLNSALRSLVLVRPDSNVTKGSIQLVAGTHQDIPTAAVRLMSITRNMGADGNTPGKIITPINTELLNLTNQLWHQDTAKTYIDHYMLDDESPRTFFVSPPVHAVTAVYVEMEYSVIPTVITATTDAFPVSDIYANPCIAWMLYRAYTVDDEEVNFQKGQAHLTEFMNLLQVELKGGLQVSPTKDE
jgi:hypothetical protein